MFPEWWSDANNSLKESLDDVNSSNGRIKDLLIQLPGTGYPSPKFGNEQKRLVVFPHSTELKIEQLKHR